jgi:hypothetical protein
MAYTTGRYVPKPAPPAGGTYGTHPIHRIDKTSGSGTEKVAGIRNAYENAVGHIEHDFGMGKGGPLIPTARRPATYGPGRRP